MNLLSVEHLGISFGGVRAVDDVSFSISPGEIFSIIGPNGAGKTTLFNLISGVYRSDMGRVTLRGDDVSRLPPEALASRGLARTFQNLQIFARMSVEENVMVGLHRHETRNVLAHLLGLPSVMAENRRTRDEARRYLDMLHLRQVVDEVAGSLSYGELKRLEIARAMASRPDILLLDEPAAGCNPTETAEIDEIIVSIARTGVAILLVEHDMKLVMGVSDRVLVLNQGRVLAEGAPDEVARNPSVIDAYLGHDKGAAGGDHV